MITRTQFTESDIDKKIDELPTISFDDNEEFQRVVMSQDFTDIFNYIMQTRDIPDKIRALNEIDQRISLYLTLTSQDENFITQSDRILYARHFPDIEEFLDNNFYMGLTSGMIYPYWREKMLEMFDKGSTVKKAVFTGCIGCLTGDTVVDTLSGEYTMKELVENHKDKWVLSFNTSTKSWEPDKIIDAFSTGIKDIYEITLDNGEKIKCTSNHQFLARNNKWVSIDNGLVEGLSMMPYYCNYTKKGYKTVKSVDDKFYIPRYMIVGKWKGWCKGLKVDIHHKNYNKEDDRPQNLCLIDKNTHLGFHAKKGGIQFEKYNKLVSGDEFIEYRSIRAKKGRETYSKRLDFEEKEKIRKRGLIRSCQDLEHQKKASLAGWSGEIGKKHRIQSSKQITEYNKSEKAKLISKKNAEHMRNILQQKSDAEKQLILLKKSLAALGRHKGKDSFEYIDKLREIRNLEPYYDPTLTPKQRWKLKQQMNHKIISIKYIGKEEVFDLTTEKNHNFALKSGIIAHNSGKSTIARKCSIYSLYKVLCLRHPRAVFNIDNDATLASFIYSITLKTVYETNLMPFIKILTTMPCFERVQKISAFKNFDITNESSPIPYCVTGSGGDTTIHFANNVIQFAGSQETHQTGRNIFNAFLDEVSEKGLEDGLRIINALDARISSRFQGSNFTFFSIVSSAKEKASPIGAYIRSIPSDDKETIVFSPKLWEVKPDPDFQGDGRTFTVLVGNGIIPSRIIDNEIELEQIKNGEFVLQNGCEIIEPPLFYKQKFEMNIDQAIQDIAGIATGGEDLVFRDTSKLQDNNLCPEIHFVADLGKKTDLFQFLPPHLFTTDLNGKKRFKRAPNAERVIHLDLAEASGETEAGIGLMHKELYKAPNSVFPEEMYVVDFIGYVNSKTRIDLEAIQNLYIKLVTEYGCNIRLMSSDQHQGELMRQFFDNHRLATETAYISVDRTLQPYNNAARLIELGRVKVGKCPYLIEQMENVGIRSGKAVRLNTTRKDMTDVLCGMIEGARICNLSAAYTYSTSSQEKENKDHIQSLLKTDQFLVDI